MTEHAWQLLRWPREPGRDGYFEHARSELLDLLNTPPQRFLDVGCGTGVTGAELKRRHPSAIVDGVELNAAAAALAEARLDTVHCGDAGIIDWAAHYALASIDALLLADVLEHLYDPWGFLLRIRPFLAPAAQVIASIPNIRNLALLSKLAGGTFEYEPAGLLDVTHVRFFTRVDILKLFDQTGYDVTWIGNVRDPQIPDISTPAFPVDLETGNIVVRGVTPEVLTELLTIQFYVRAQPRADGQSGPTAAGDGSGT